MDTKMFTTLTFSEVEPGVGLVTLNRPERLNAVNPNMVKDFETLFAALAEDETMIGIRGKSQTRRPLKDLTEGKVTLAKWINIIGLPVLFVVLGVFRWRLRRGSRRRRAERLVLGARGAKTGAPS